jgi:hypothetical protein
MRLFVLLVLVSCKLFAQQNTPTTEIEVSGDVNANKKITLEDIRKLTAHEIEDVVITNHLGEKKSEAKGLRGILFKDLLQSVDFKAESPRVLSEFSIICKANDGYTVVYSWNELFNSPVGESVFIITEKEGKKMGEMNDSILMLSSKDYKTGRRHLKALAKIEIKRAI